LQGLKNPRYQNNVRLDSTPTIRKTEERMKENINDLEIKCDNKNIWY